MSATKFELQINFEYIKAYLTLINGRLILFLMIHRAGRVYFYGFDKNRFLEKNKSPILPKK